MHDYQLERLNTRSFEQLVQALGLEIIGKQLMIFGDGPDGGREATFDGPIKYPEGKTPWNGYGIVQAKFRQQPDSLAKKNADWAIKELKAEFAKLKPRPKLKKDAVHGDRSCPEFYIFATNLSLSPVGRTGGKDRVREVLDGFKKSHGLRGYAIWDGDQIRRFLDTQPSIRSTYAAWLLSSDVLADMMEYLKLAQTDFPSTIRRYLEVELLDDQYAKLGQGGYTDANAIPLSNVFVDLPIEIPPDKGPRRGVLQDTEVGESDDNELKTSEKKRATFLESFFEEGRQVLRPSANLHKVSQTPNSRRTPGRVVVIGGPGQGKTTVGQFACQLLRASLLKVTCATYSPEVDQALTRIEQQSRDVAKSKVLRYPIRVDLKRLAEALVGEGDFPANSILDYLVQHVSKRTDSELSKKEFRTWLQSYPWLLVLDGLDEVPASSNRTKMMDAIRNFVSVEAHQLDADLLVLATTRPQGYSDEFDPELYFHLPLAPLNASEALEYGTKLASARHPGLKSRIDELTKSLNRATTNPATVRLMESPLQVTIMLALIEGGGEPPEQRWKLFHDYYDVIYRREKERGTPFSALLGKYEPEIHWLHHRAGWLLQQRNSTAGATAARLTHTEFEGMVDDRLLKRGHSDATKRGALVAQILQAATNRLVFLVGNTTKEIGFEIRSLQEFMAAEHCFDGSESCVHETIRTIAPHPYWRNVFLFIAGRIFFEKESLIDSLIAVCERLNETLTDQGPGVTVAGSRLALAMLKDGVSRNQPENSRVLARCAAKVLDAMLPNEASGLVPLFMSEAGDVWKEELSRRLRATGTAFPHIPWCLCLELVCADNEFAIELMLADFPWKHAEVGRFLFVTIRNPHKVPDRFWLLFKEHVFVHSPTIWRIRFFGEELPEPLNCDPFIQLLAIYAHQGIEDVRLLDEDGKETCNHLRICGEEGIKRWAVLKVPIPESGEMHPTWRSYHAVSEFARQYSSSSLAEHFVKMVEADPHNESESVTFEFPWQFKACFAAQQAGLPVQQISKSVIAGALGHCEDWARWDLRRKDGIKISELVLPDSVLSVSDHHQGAVYTNASWSHSHIGGEFDFAAALSHSLPRLRQDRTIGNVLVNVCCFGLNKDGLEWEPEDVAKVEGFLMRCIELKIPMTRDIVVAIVQSSLEPETKVRLLGLVCIEMKGRSWLRRWETNASNVDASCRVMLDGLNASASMVDVLAAISFLPPLPFATLLPDSALEKCRLHGERYREAANLLHINRLAWEKTGAQVATEVLQLRSRYPQYLEELLEFIDSQGISNANLEAFVTTLMRTPESDLQDSFGGQLLGLLIKLVERRPPIELLPDPSSMKPQNRSSTQ